MTRPSEPMPPARPGCGEKFCERCGDCLACYGGENCYGGGVDNGDHIWPVPDRDGVTC